MVDGVFHFIEALAQLSTERDVHHDGTEETTDDTVHCHRALCKCLHHILAESLLGQEREQQDLADDQEALGGHYTSE